jgi:cell division protein FtsA
MLPFLKRSKSKKETSFLALDIGTEVVKALVCVTRDNKAEVLGVGRQHQKIGDMYHGAVLDIGSVIDNCHNAILDAEKQSDMYPEQIIMGIAGELVKGTTTVTTYMRKDANEQIDLAELKNIIHKMQWKASEQARTQIALESGVPEIDVKLVHAAIADIRIDGFNVTNPLGFKGKEVTLSIFNAFAPLTHYGALQTIGAELELDLLAIAAEPFAIARSMSYEDETKKSGIFIDIGGGTTDIAVVRNGTIEGTKMFTLGGRTFTKRIAHSLNVALTEAEDIKIAYSHGQLEKHSETIVKQSLQSDIEVWLSGVSLALSEIPNIDIFPSHIYLCGGASLLPEVKKGLEEKVFYKDLTFAKKPIVTLLQPKNIATVIDKTKQLKNVEDITPMALANLAIELAGEEHILGKLLKKAVRLMQV